MKKEILFITTLSLAVSVFSEPLASFNSNSSQQFKPTPRVVENIDELREFITTTKTSPYVVNALNDQGLASGQVDPLLITILRGPIHPVIPNMPKELTSSK